MAKELPRVAIIGAGSSGIAACKTFSEQGIPWVCYEASDRIGGMWVYNNRNGMSSAYRSLHINTSRRRMDYSDFPMPEDYPDFPGHEQIADYFESYVDHFGIREGIRFNCRVERCRRDENGIWAITTEHGTTEYFDALVVANGHHWYPHWPEPDFPGHFNGEKLHSHYYKEPTAPLDLTGKRVVLVGMGNSAMDIACELGRKGVAERVFLSARSGVYIFPKYLGGKPLDEQWRHPARKPGLAEHILRRLIPERWVEALMLPVLHRVLRLVVGEPEQYGLPAPKGGFGHTHPTISEEIHVRVGSGDVIPKPAIRAYHGTEVEFADGSREQVDAVIYCTGYEIRFPFFEPGFMPVENNDVALYQRMVDPRYDNLFFLALVQPLCAMMPIAEQQSRWIAAWLTGDYHPPSREAMEKQLRREHQRMKEKFTDSPRHTIEIDCQDYTYWLRDDLKKGRKRARRANNSLPVPARATSVDGASGVNPGTSE